MFQNAKPTSYNNYLCCNKLEIVYDNEQLNFVIMVSLYN